MKKAVLIVLFLALASGASFAQTSIQGRSVDVRAFGAKCDGTTNDQTAIAAAISAVTSTGGIVNFPDGTCVVTGLTVPGGVTLQGKGKFTTILKSGTNGVILNLVQGSGDFAFRGPKIADLWVDGSDTGSSQIGIQVTDASAVRDTIIENVTISDCGSHGLSIGNAFSSQFKNISSTSNQGYNFFYLAPNMPANYFYGLYSGDVSSSAPAGYRIKQGDFTCWSCNGVDAVPGTAYWAVIGGWSGDIDGDVTSFFASAHFTDCNIEGAPTAGIFSYPGSGATVDGLSKFVGLSGSSGSWVAMLFDTDVSLTPENAKRWYIDDTVVFANSPASFYANSQPIHADGMPPLSVNGRGPQIAGGGAAGMIATFYNSATSRTEPLARVDGYAPVIELSGDGNYTSPGPRAFRMNCALNCGLTLPSPTYYQNGNEVITVMNLSATGIQVTISANGGAAVNGSTYVLSVQGASVQLYPDYTALNWIVVGNRIGAGFANYYALFDSANTITQSGSKLSNSASNLVSAATLLFGTDNTYNIGTAGDNRPAHIYSATDIISPKIYNVSGGACYTSGSASPEGSVTCEPGSIYLRTNGSWYIKASGSGNTGWSLISTTALSGSGTTNTITKFTGATSIGDSLITESTSPNTITIGARESITGLTVNTDATNTVASLTAAATFTKNDTNTRTFDVVRIKPTLNFGGSNTGTTVNYLNIDSTNTAATGATVNLIYAQYGGSLKFGVDSAGAITFATGVRQVFVPSTSVASLNVGQVASDPVSPVNGDVIYNTGSNKFRCYENSAWSNCIGATPTLTSTQVPFGDGSNLLTSSSAFTYNTSTKSLSIVNGSGSTQLVLNGSSDTSNVKFGAASMPGNQGGIFLPFVGGSNSSGPGIWWGSSASYSSLNAIYLDNGFTFQGASSTHDNVKIRAATGTSSNGTTRYTFAPSSSLLTQTLSTSATNTNHEGGIVDLSSTGTAAAGFGYSQLVKLENGSGSQVNALRTKTTWTTATASSETSKYEIMTNTAGAGLSTAFAVDASQYYGTVQALGSKSGSFTIDFSAGNYVTATITGNWTTVTFSNIKAGARYVLKVTQNGVGGWTWTPPSTFKYPGGIATNILTTTAGAVDVFICDSVDGSNLLCNGLFDVQ